MVKVQGPAMSLEASGSLGGAIVFSRWKGRPYVRELVTPANPRSGGQVGMRAMFKFLTQDWTNLAAGEQATWEDRAAQLVVSTFNAFVSYNQFRWRDFRGPSKEDPAAESDTIPVLGALSLSAGVRSITATQAITTANDGWGVLFFRSPSGTFDTAYDNLIGCGKINATADVVWVDSPLAAGTYYYDTRGFSEEGLLTAETGEQNETVT